jgi:hypothetical protein
LEEPAKGAVNDAVTLEKRGPTRTSVRRVQKRDQALVGVLLGVAGQGAGNAPGGREERGGAERGLGRRGVGGCEEAIELTAGAVLFVLAPARVVFVAEEIVPEERVV